MQPEEEQTRYKKFSSATTSNHSTPNQSSMVSSNSVSNQPMAKIDPIESNFNAVVSDHLY